MPAGKMTMFKKRSSSKKVKREIKQLKAEVRQNTETKQVGA